MTSRRLLKAAAAIREVVSMAILTDLKDPRVTGVTVTSVEVAPDMRQAKVFVSIMGSETQQNLALRGLQHAAGFLQSKLNERIETRYIPRLQFVLDMGVKKSIEIAQILQRVLNEGTGAAAAAETAGQGRAADAVDDEIDDEIKDDETQDTLADEEADDELDDDETDDDGEDKPGKNR